MKCVLCVNDPCNGSHMVVHKPTSVKIKKPRRFLEIGAQAKALKISRYHLWNVLTGRRVSPTLLARYEALTGKPHVIPPVEGPQS